MYTLMTKEEKLVVLDTLKAIKKKVTWAINTYEDTLERLGVDYDLDYDVLYEHFNILSDGICLMLKKRLYGADLDTHTVRNIGKQTRELFTCWEHFSGNSTYPVPVSKEQMTRERNPLTEDDVSFAFETEVNLWAGEYGAYRMSLLDHLIKSVEGELNVAQK